MGQDPAGQQPLPALSMVQFKCTASSVPVTLQNLSSNLCAITFLVSDNKTCLAYRGFPNEARKAIQAKPLCIGDHSINHNRKRRGGSSI